MLRIVIIFMLVLVLPQSAHAQTVISGQVISEDGTPLVALIHIDGKQLPTSSGGSFTATVTDQSIYQIYISADGFYPSVHTFSKYELATALPTPNQIPAITLVAKKQGRTMMVFGGDAMMGRRYSKPFPGEPVLIRPDHKAADTKSILRHMKPYLESADFASVNLETQVIETEPTAKAPKFVTFFTPPEAIDALAWAGVDYVTLGNNHTYDYLDTGLRATLDNLNERGMAFSGAGLTESEALRSYEVQLNGHKYALQGYVGWAGSAKPSQVAEGDMKGGPPLGTFEKITTQVSYDRQLGATPIVQYHGSLEYSDEPSLDTETRLKGAIDAGAAIALGHHPHVYQGLEVYRGKLIAWSLGNFSFDQYFYTAQKSALLYVWMDGEAFHRAEVVPIYLKGYVPTPATGDMRHSILKRIAKLSARRNTHISVSGGHGVVQSAGAGSATTATLNYRALSSTNSAAGVFSLTNRSWETNISGIDSLPTGATYRFGRDLLNRGDVETYSNFDAPDRSWLDMAANVQLTDSEAASGENSLEVNVPMSSSTETGMRKFTRAYTPGSPSTATAMVKSEKPTTVVFLFQKRGTRDGLSAALENNPKTELGRMKVAAGKWQRVAADFISPRVGARSYRILIEVVNDGSETTSTLIDDIALIEWQTPFLSRSNSDTSWQANDFSHVQLMPPD